MNKDKIRVLYVPSSDDKYGAPKSMMELVKNLKERHGIEPLLLVCSEGLITKWCKENNIEYYILNQPAFMVVGGSNTFRKIVKHSLYPILKLKYMINYKKAKKNIEEIMNNKQIDIIHTNVNRIDIGAYYALKHNIPHIWHLREFGKEDYNCMYLRRDAISFMNKSATRCIAISNAVKKAWVEKGLDNRKLEIIYNGIDLSKFSNTYVEKGEKEKIEIVFAGIISETKGQIYLIKAIELLPEEIKNKVHVDFYGGGREKYIKKLSNYVHKKELDNYISFKGYSSNLYEIFPNYDIGVVASKSEAFGRVTVEYMAAGLCTIVSDTGANTELIQNDENGYIYKYKDIQELSNIIKDLVNNKEKIKRVSKYSFDNVKNKFSMDICSDNIYNLYTRILEEK